MIQRLQTYSGEVIISKRVGDLNVKYKRKMYNLGVLVVLGSGPSLLGRRWLESLLINLFDTANQIKWIDVNQEFSEPFKLGLVILKNATAKLYMNQNSIPHFIKARSVPLMIRKKVESEHDRMVATSLIKPVNFSG